MCGRAVPDGATHQFVGGLFSVVPGTERDLIDILDEADGYDLMTFLGEWERPPALATREGEALVECRAVLEVEDPDEARRVLEQQYEVEEDGTDVSRWVELFDLHGDGLDRVLRATLVLPGNRLEVTTTSEERIDRVLRLLAAELPSSKVVTDERRPLDADTMLSSAFDSPDPFEEDDTPALRAALDQIRDRFERRWCDEPGPDDDIVSSRAGGAMLRPARLRGLLGLDSRRGVPDYEHSSTHTSSIRLIRVVFDPMRWEERREPVKPYPIRHPRRSRRGARRADAHRPAAHGPGSS